MEEATIAIRIQLGPMPTMLGEIVVQMLGNRDTIVVGRSAPGDDLLAAARRAGAHLLVMRAHPGGGQPIDDIVAAPDLNILLISDDGCDGSLIRLAQEPVSLDRASISGLALRVGGRA